MLGLVGIVGASLNNGGPVVLIGFDLWVNVGLMMSDSSLLLRPTECYHSVDLCEYLFDHFVQQFPKAIAVLVVVQSCFGRAWFGISWQASFQRSSSHHANARGCGKQLTRQTAFGGSITTRQRPQVFRLQKILLIIGMQVSHR